MALFWCIWSCTWIFFIFLVGQSNDLICMRYAVSITLVKNPSIQWEYLHEADTSPLPTWKQQETKMNSCTKFISHFCLVVYWSECLNFLQRTIVSLHLCIHSNMNAGGICPNVSTGKLIHQDPASLSSIIPWLLCATAWLTNEWGINRKGVVWGWSTVVKEFTQKLGCNDDYATMMIQLSELAKTLSHFSVCASNSRFNIVKVTSLSAVLILVVQLTQIPENCNFSTKNGTLHTSNLYRLKVSHTVSL